LSGELDTEVVEPCGRCEQRQYHYEIRARRRRRLATDVVAKRRLSYRDPQKGADVTLDIESFDYEPTKRYPITVTNAKNHSETRVYEGHGHPAEPR